MLKTIWSKLRRSREHRVLDWSNYSNVPTDAKIKKLKAAGWEGVILGTQKPLITLQQYDACKRNGLRVFSLYVFVYWDAFGPGSDYGLLDNAIMLAKKFGLRVWLDCEWECENNGWLDVPVFPTPPAAELLARIKAYKRYLGRYYRGIYTGRWWWTPRMNNSTEFRLDALWDANYRLPDIAHWISYGGWSHPLVIQYSSAGVDGLVTDLNEWFETEEEEMFIRHNAAPEWWQGAPEDPAKNGRSLPKTPDNERQQATIAADFGLPEEATRVRFGVYTLDGYVRWFDGDSIGVAGITGWGTTPRYDVVEALLDDEGNIEFEVESAVAKIALLECLGYYVDGAEATP